MENGNKLGLRLAGKILSVTALISLAILLTGYFLHWNGSVKFSNSFFVVGAILIALGILSIAGGFIQRSSFEMLYAESAGQMGSAERTRRMAADITQRYGTLIFLVITGLLLIGISVVIGKFL